MIFVNNIEKSIALEKYLQSFPSKNLKNRDKKIIISFLSILKTKTRTNYLKDFLNSNTNILICIDATGIRVDIPDIKYVIQ